MFPFRPMAESPRADAAPAARIRAWTRLLFTRESVPGVDARPPVRARECVLVASFMAVLTVVMTWPQAVHLDQVRDLGDPLFSVWRLAWIAHQLPRDPLHLFDANIFVPEHGTLAFSDAMLLPGVAGAPLLWLGVPAIPFYNLFLLATFVLAGVAMYLLVRFLTGQRAAALVAGVIFAFYPFRFEHYSHLELQFSWWMPLVLLGLHRTLVHGRLRDGLWTGGAMAAQMLSCVYFGIFLGGYLVPVGGVLAIGWRRVRRAALPLAAGAVLAGVLCAPMMRPYLDVKRTFGERTPKQASFFSARPGDYLMAHSTRIAYAGVLRPERRHALEKDLFPGFVVVLLAGVALWPPLAVSRIAYALGLGFAFWASLGMHGFLFPLLRLLAPFGGIRSPARFSMLVGLSLAVLAGYGVARLLSRVRRRWLGTLVAATLSLLVLTESRSYMPLQIVPAPSPIYRWFDTRPTSIIAELPAASRLAPWHEARYLYFSTFHWQQLVNGSSGLMPPSYVTFAAAMVTFPDAASRALLRARRVAYVVVHEEFYGRDAYARVVSAIAQCPDLREVSRVSSGGFEARIYQLGIFQGRKRDD
jgi:hypothetical protein